MLPGCSQEASYQPDYWLIFLYKQQILFLQTAGHLKILFNLTDPINLKK